MVGVLLTFNPKASINSVSPINAASVPHKKVTNYPRRNNGRRFGWKSKLRNRFGPRMLRSFRPQEMGCGDAVMNDVKWCIGNQYMGARGVKTLQNCL